MAQFSDEGIEELQRRIAKKAKNDEQIQRIFLFANLPFDEDLIEEVVLLCDIIIENNDVLLSYPSEVGRYAIYAGSRIADLINEELGEVYGFIQVPKER